MVIMRRASVDFGSKRSGIAVTDPSGTVVTDVKTVPPFDIVKELKKVELLSEVIVGLPLNLKGKFTKSTSKAVDKALEISREMAPIPVYMVDERFTSNIANREIFSSNSKKNIVDELSASLILQDYMKGKIKSYRVFHTLPMVSQDVANFFRALSPNKIIMIGSALRGLENHGFPRCDIYEDNPVYFRLREVNIFRKKLRITLHFGVVWDIILPNVEVGDVVVCDLNHRNEMDLKKFPPKVKIVSEDEDGYVRIGERLLNFFEVKSQ
jgi:putative Holliday junction resolvase